MSGEHGTLSLPLGPRVAKPCLAARRFPIVYVLGGVKSEYLRRFGVLQ